MVVGERGRGGSENQRSLSGLRIPPHPYPSPPAKPGGEGSDNEWCACWNTVRKWHSRCPRGVALETLAQEGEDGGLLRTQLVKRFLQLRLRPERQRMRQRAVEIRIDHRGVHVALAADG